METEINYKPTLSVDEFKRSRNRILAGNTEEFERVMQTFNYTIEQYTILAECHELVLKSVK